MSLFFSSPAAILVRNSRLSTNDSNDTDQSSVPFSSKRFQMLLVRWRLYLREMSYLCSRHEKDAHRLSSEFGSVQHKQQRVSLTEQQWETNK